MTMSLMHLFWIFRANLPKMRFFCGGFLVPFATRSFVGIEYRLVAVRAFRSSRHRAGFD